MIDKKFKKEMVKTCCDQRSYFLAIESLKKEIKKGFDLEKNHMRLGRLYREIGKYNLSIEEFGKAFEFSPHKKEMFFRNKILNEIEISQRKTILKSKPRYIQLGLTNRCNLKCIMCEVWKTPWDVPRKTIDEIIEYLPNLQNIHYVGGEVFLSQYFEELFEKASFYPNLKQDIITNGLLIDDNWAKRLAQSHFLSLNYSIDSVVKDNYEQIRKGAKYEDLLRSINIINEYKQRCKIQTNNGAKFYTTINFVMMKSNYSELELLIDFANKYKFDAVQPSPIQGVTGPENIFLNNDSEAASYIEGVIPEVLRKAAHYGIIVNSNLPPIRNSSFQINNFGTIPQEQRNNFNDYISHTKQQEMLCYWPWKHLHIDIGGNVRPHCLCRIDIGNIHQSSLEEIWNNETIQMYRQKVLNNKYIDLCGSRCVSYVIPKEELGFGWED